MSNEPSREPRFGAATGYATAVDAALAWAEDDTIARPCLPVLSPLRKKNEGTTDTAARILAAEVRRLRSDRDRLLAAIDDAICWANGRQYEWGERAENAFALIERASAESHNVKLNDGAKPGEVGHE